MRKLSKLEVYWFDCKDSVKSRSSLLNYCKLLRIRNVPFAFIALTQNCWQRYYSIFKFPIRATEPFTLCEAADLHHHELIWLTLRTYLVDIIGANRTTYTHSEIYAHAEKKWTQMADNRKYLNRRLWDRRTIITLRITAIATSAPCLYFQ